MQIFIQDFLHKNTKKKFILVRGISAWESKQLENEIANNDWFIVQPDLKELFSSKTKNKWQYLTDQIGLKDGKYIVSYTGNA